MASRMWLLVDWVDEGNDNSVYGIVNIDITAYDDIEIIPGNVTFIRTRDSGPRRARIVLVSEHKEYIKKQKALLEVLQRHVNDVHQWCTQTINEVGSEVSYNGIRALRNSRNLSRFRPTFNSRHNRMPSMSTQLRHALTENSSRQRSIMCSTPLPSSSSQQVTSVTINQATQTEMSFGPIVDSIEILEQTTNNLYGQLSSIISQANGNPSTSGTNHNNEVIMVRPNRTECLQQSSGSSLSGLVQEILVAEEMESSNDGSIGLDQEHNSSNVSNSNIGVGQELPNNSNDSNPNIPRVRRVSAQSTSNIEPVPDLCDDDELVPLGNGPAGVSRRLLKNIDKMFYKHATRQLLTEIFTRRVLATHSLSGKQSPAFLNIPAKRILHPEIVEDIVTTVSTRCCVSKNLVRKVITTKCSDEAKLYRIRERRRQLRQPRNNEENLRLSTSSSD